MLFYPWDSPGRKTGVGCHSLLQGIFLTQGLNLCLLHCRQILYHLSHQKSPNVDFLIVSYFKLDLWVNVVKIKMLMAQLCPTLCDTMNLALRLLCPWNSPGKNTGVGCHFLLQGIFPTQGWNPGLLHRRQIPYCLSHQKSHWVNVELARSLQCEVIFYSPNQQLG